VALGQIGLYLGQGGVIGRRGIGGFHLGDQVGMRRDAGLGEMDLVAFPAGLPFLAVADIGLIWGTESLRPRR
jgi:hypothetical protein